MKFVALPQYAYTPAGVAERPKVPPIYVQPEHVSGVVDSSLDGEVRTSISLGGAFYEIALSTADVLRILGATVTEVVFRDVQP